MHLFAIRTSKTLFKNYYCLALFKKILKCYYNASRFVKVAVNEEGR